MTKEWLMDYLEDLEDGEEVNMNQIIRDYEEGHARYIEELEEEQHASGFYAFQDLLDMYHRER